MPEAWPDYTWAHWIEDDPANGDDGSFSSPGAFGFLPVDRTRRVTYYGVLARMDKLKRRRLHRLGRVRVQDIRKAFFTGDVYASGAPAH